MFEFEWSIKALQFQHLILAKCCINQENVGGPHWRQSPLNTVWLLLHLSLHPHDLMSLDALVSRGLGWEEQGFWTARFSSPVGTTLKHFQIMWSIYWSQDYTWYFELAKLLRLIGPPEVAGLSAWLSHTLASWVAGLVHLDDTGVDLAGGSGAFCFLFSPGLIITWLNASRSSRLSSDLRFLMSLGLNEGVPLLSWLEPTSAPELRLGV